VDCSQQFSGASGFIKLGNSRVSERLLASQEGLSSMELVYCEFWDDCECKREYLMIFPGVLFDSSSHVLR
jgi:hypothetical protein